MLLSYITENPSVQMVFIVAVLLLCVAIMMHRGARKDSELKHEKENLDRDERMLTIEHKKPAPAKEVQVYENG